LARQAWRILQYPDSLCARLLKARYFPNRILLDTVFLAEASPTWRGIEHGLELLKKGVVWRVGDGSKIDIHRYNWIPRRTPMTITNVKKRTRCRKVKELFIQGTRQWNEGKIREIFYPHDADEIIKLELMQHDEDVPAWHYESTGVFSVKSAYKLAFNIQRETHFNSSNSGTGDDSRNIRNLIWRCKVPNKIRIFAWRCASDNLATKKNK
jgi:hypothetical protein